MRYDYIKAYIGRLGFRAHTEGGIVRVGPLRFLARLGHERYSLCSGIVEGWAAQAKAWQLDGVWWQVRKRWLLGMVRDGLWCWTAGETRHKQILIRLLEEHDDGTGTEPCPRPEQHLSGDDVCGHAPGPGAGGAADPAGTCGPRLQGQNGGVDPLGGSDGQGTRPNAGIER